MNKQANILFFTRSSSGGGRVDLSDSFITNRYYRHLVRTVLARASDTRESFEYLGQQLAFIAQDACRAREIDVTEQAAQLMLGLPLSTELHTIARYVQAQALRYRRDFDGARQLFSLVAEASTPAFRARALQCIGATYHEAGEIDEAPPFYIAAGNAAAGCAPLTSVESQVMLAIVRSLHGDHRQAVDDLENLFPLVRAVGRYQPAVFYGYLNNLAVELGEVGRLDEAHRALNFALASPFAGAHSEWAETRDELEAKRTAATPSIVAVTRAPGASISPIAQLDPKPRSAGVLAESCLLVGTSSPPKLRPAARAAGHHALTTSGLDRLDNTIQPRAPPSRS